MNSPYCCVLLYFRLFLAYTFLNSASTPAEYNFLFLVHKYKTIPITTSL